MNKKNLLKLLDDIQEDGDDTVKDKRILFIDGLNLFFRNFAMLNMVNPDGVHVGGLGGFFRSLGAMIRQTNPTDVYVIFDGAGSANNRKNIVPEYKSGRNNQRVTNWEVFENLDKWSNKYEWKRNQTLIDLNFIPEEYEVAIIEEFKKEPKGKRNKLLNYFIKHNLKNFVDHIEEF